jgi:predicted nucleic acid-binding protein
MKVLVDTAVWSLALRRRSRAANEPTTPILRSLVEDGRVAMIGPIRQELLSGIREQAHFDRLRSQLDAFTDIAITPEDYVEATSFFNRCRTSGIQGSNTDFLICAIATRNDFPILTTDQDFRYFVKVLPIVLFEAAG